MKRLAVAVVSVLVAVVLCVFGRVDAGDDPLTPEMKKQIDASLVVFVGEIEKLGPAPSTSGGLGETRQWVAYKVGRVLKGTCFEPRLTVEHVVQNHADPKGAGLDPALFSPGKRVVVGVQLCTREPPSYTLQCTSKHFGPVAWTQTVEDAVGAHVLESLGFPAAVISKAMAAQHRQTCVNNLNALGQCWLMMAQENRARAQKCSGPALWLALRKNQDMIERGRERVLLCPDDPSARPATSDEERKAWDDVDLTQPLLGLCSYCGRDFVRFPIKEESVDKEPIGACLHHEDGAVIVFADSEAKFMTLEELGLATDADLKVGPDSKSPLLRKLR
jgi:hypothetical protein